MNIEIVKSEKDDMEILVDNQTVAELMRFYLNKHGAKFAAWRKEHSSKPILMKIQSSSGTVKKLVADAVAEAHKDIEAISTAIKKK